MANMDILNALAAQSATVSPGAELKSFEEDEDKRTAEALKALIEQVPSSVMNAGRAPSAEKKPEVSAKSSKVIPKFDSQQKDVIKGKEGLDWLSSQIKKELQEAGGIGAFGKTTEQISKEASEALKQRPTLTEEQANIDLLQSQIDSLEGEKKKKKQEVESYLDQAIADIAKKPEGMGLLEIVGKSMIALAPGIIGAKVAGYRGGQYAQEGATKAMQSLMETEEARRQAAQKIQAEMSKVRASLSKDEMDNIASLQKELIKGQIDLRTLPLKNQLEFTRLLSARELTKDQRLELAKLLTDLSKQQIQTGEQRAAPKAGAGAGAGFTPGQKRLDEKYAESLNEWSTGGGYAGAMEGISRLRQVFEPLKSSDSITGPIVGRLPIEPPTTAKIRQDIEKTAQVELKRILGAQVTEKEVSAFLQRTFDPKLEESVNLERVERELSRLQQIVDLRQQQAEYFQQTGSLKGFPLSKKLEELNVQFTTGSSAPSAGAAIKLTKELFEKMSAAQRIEYQNATPARRQDILKSL